MWQALITILSLSVSYMLTSFHRYKKLAQDRILSITGNVIYSLKILWQLNTEKVLEMSVHTPSNNLMQLLA